MLGVAWLWGCGADQGPAVEEPINGTWDLEGFFALDVRGFVKCRFTGTLQLAQLPGGVNTVQGEGTQSFDCDVDGVAQDPLEREADLEFSRYTGETLSMTWGECSMGADYVPTRPNVLAAGRAFCRLSFFETGVIDVAGAWEGTRRTTP